MIPVICVTGPMAAGKNTVSGEFARRGWRVIDFDTLVHGAIEKMSPVIIEEFNGEAEAAGIKIEANGIIDRRALGKLLFGHPALLARQEAIVLPAVEKEAEEAVLQSESPVVLNAVSLYKTPRLISLCSVVIYVTAPYLARVRRVRRRDGLPYMQIIKRFNSQRGLLAEYKKTGVPIAIYPNP